MQPAHLHPSNRSAFVFEFVSGGGMANLDLPASWLEEGRAMLEAAVQALADNRIEVVTTIDARFDFPLPARTIRVEYTDQVETILTDALQSTDFGLIIAPESDGILQRLTTLAESAPGWHLGSSADAVVLGADKLATSLHLLQNPNLRRLMPPTLNGSSCTHVSERVVIKPVEGAGSIDTFVVAGSTLELAFARLGLDRSRFVVQEFVPGVSAGLSLLSDGMGKVEHVAACMHDVTFESIEQGIDRIVLKDGHPANHVSEQAITIAAEAVRAIPGLRGWVGVDVILDANGKLSAILEINPRLTSSFVWALNRTDRSDIMSRWLALHGSARV
jgi:predicted ATP-grasp superfamily ATP-dependent carboligase